MKRMVIFGLGYSAQVIARRLQAQGWQVAATGRAGDMAFEDAEAVHAALSQADAVLSSVPPAEGADPVLAAYGGALAGRWLGYLSSTGVYGDTGGAWVDETAPLGGGRRSARAEADSRWLDMDAHVFRLPGIYGPGRSAFDRLREGRAHRIDLPDQVFSRVHVEDIARGVLAGLSAPAGAYNLADNEPTSQNTVIEHAARLAGLPVPPLQTLEQAGLSPAARAFYAENRRIANGRAARVLGWTPLYPTFREGLAAVLAAGG